MSAKESKKFYRFCYRAIGPVLRFVRPFKVVGAENICEGAAIICANHSAMIDPFHIALSLDVDTQLHILGKIELFRIPIISAILNKLGMIPVDRGTADAGSVKRSMYYLKKGEKIVIFPEGTRMSEHDATAAKTGAVKLAERTRSPIIPVFIPRKKPAFRRSPIIFGEPYYIEKLSERRSASDYARLSEELMNKIQAMEGAL